MGTMSAKTIFIPHKQSNTYSLRLSYFIFIEYLSKIREIQQSEPQTCIHTHDLSHFQTSWIRPCMLTYSDKLDV